VFSRENLLVCFKREGVGVTLEDKEYNLFVFNVRANKNE